jgi:hypothetical protein
MFTRDTLSNPLQERVKFVAMKKIALTVVKQKEV